MPKNGDIHALTAALAALPLMRGGGEITLTKLETGGISHLHYRIQNQGLILRVPRFARWGEAGPMHLAYQETAFTRAVTSGHTPALHAVMPATETMSGGLVVDDIDGRSPRLTERQGGADLGAIASALAAIHCLNVPPTQDMAPLLHHADPVGETVAVIERQATAFEAVGLVAEAADGLAAELAWAREFAADTDKGPSPIHLVGTDTHPGNFLIDAAGRAWFVDLEKLLYGNPAIDLAHATLATSTGWYWQGTKRQTPNPTPAMVRGFYRQYLSCLSAKDVQAILPWLAPMRRLTWLRTMSWFARWRADWSHREELAVADRGHKDHIEAHIDSCFDPNAIAAARAEWLNEMTEDAFL